MLVLCSEEIFLCLALSNTNLQLAFTLSHSAEAAGSYICRDNNAGIMTAGGGCWLHTLTLWFVQFFLLLQSWAFYMFLMLLLILYLCLSVPQCHRVEFAFFSISRLHLQTYLFQSCSILHLSVIVLSHQRKTSGKSDTHQRRGCFPQTVWHFKESLCLL